MKACLFRHSTNLIFSTDTASQAKSFLQDNQLYKQIIRLGQCKVNQSVEVEIVFSQSRNG